MGMLDAVILNVVNHIKTLTSIINSKLDQLVASSGGMVAPKARIRKPQTTNYFATTTDGVYNLLSIGFSPNITIFGSNMNITTTNILNITGSGKLKQLFAKLQCSVAGGPIVTFGCTIHVYIDNELYVSVQRTKSGGNTATSYISTFSVLGDLIPVYNGTQYNNYSSTTMEEVVFNSSLKIDAVMDCSGSVLGTKTASIYYEYETN